MDLTFGFIVAGSIVIYGKIGEKLLTFDYAFP